MPYQSLHSPGKFRCLRNENFVTVTDVSNGRTSPHPCSPPPGSGDDIYRSWLCPTIFPHPVSEIVFPFEDLELNRLRNIFLLSVSLYLLWKPDSGISIHVLCSNVCVLCFNVKYENKAFTICFSSWCLLSFWMLEAGTCVPFGKGV